MRRSLLLVMVVSLVTAFGTVGWAGPLSSQGPKLASSALSPFGTCTTDVIQTGTFYANTEVEPWVDVNPTNPDNIVATWQQDRWDNGGSRGLVAGVSMDGGATWTQVVIPGLSRCSGSETWIRASDPWLSFAPNGDLYHISLSTSGGITAAGLPDSSMLVSKSTDGGLSWGSPVTLIADRGPSILNDKEAITADPNDQNGDTAYAVWDRITSAGPMPQPTPETFENAIGFRGPVWFSRTTNGETWEPARMIFDPGAVDQTIGNQIVVLPTSTGGDLLDFFNLIFNFSNAGGTRGFNVAFLRSEDQGATWSRTPTIVDKMFRAQVRDPDTNQALRTADFNPEVAVDPATGNLYAVWQDRRFNGRAEVAFTMSTDGGKTWTRTMRINTGSKDAQGFLPQVHVASDGTVGVLFYDFRNEVAGTPNTLSTDAWLIHCHPGTQDCAQASSWAETHVDGPFNAREYPDAGGFFPGDYLGLSAPAAGGGFAALYIKPGGTVNTADALYASVG
ncbi:MAG TPA: sialidase family protein [Actinomycetes bacterium]|jgi:hypothetical protein|nr:sialidase family protein [Actinomycetes bacterium]